MSLTSFVLKIAAPIPKIESYDRFMFIGPHPDDIEIGAGATAAKLAAAGKDVCFLVCIDGRFGTENLTIPVNENELIEIRRNEAIASASALGVSDVRFLGMCDGGFYCLSDLIASIAVEVGKFKPDVIFAPDHRVNSECHIDHLNVGEAASRIAYFSPYTALMKKYSADPCDVKALAYYMTAKPNTYIKTLGFTGKQLKAVFENHISQFPLGCKDAKTIGLYIKLRSIDFGIKSFKVCAEAFRVLGRVQMHCLPEADKY